MLAGRLKAIREARSWSQGHLADAAQLNVRTVQRIEAGEPASHETLLSLAAALDINIAELELDERARSGMDGLSRSRAALAAVLVTPASLFIIVNLLRSAAGVAGPFDALANAGGKLVSFQTFNLVSPVVFLGGAAAAFVMCLPALVRLRTNKISRGAFNISGIELRSERTALIIAAAAVLSAGFLLSYAGLELLRTPVS